MGTGYCYLNKIKEALKYFDDSNALNPNYVETFLGKANTYRYIGEYYKALELCNTAINKDTSYFNSYRIKGAVLTSLAKFEDAIEIFYIALKLSENNAQILKDIAYCYEQMKNYPEAIAQYKKALSISKNEDFVETINFRIINIEKLISNETSLREKESREFISEALSNDEEDEFIAKTIDKHLSNESTLMKKYIERYENRSSSKEYKALEGNYLAVLKGWSSSTPEISQGIMLDLNYLKCKGGGHYLRWQGKGVVFDPGINFVENMHKVGLTVMDIDYVIVTHNHLDHCFDLSSILDMNYQYFAATGKKKFIKYFLDEDTYSKELSKFSFFDPSQEEPVPLRLYNVSYDSSSNFKKEINDNITIEYFPTKHCEKSLAFKLILTSEDKTIKLGYTSDSKFIDSFIEKFSECEIIISNFSETNPKDFKKEELKDTHLGYYGNYLLLSNKLINPKFFLLSEFWGGKGDIRFEIAKKLRKEVDIKDKGTSVIPADIGLMISLDTLKPLCSRCKNEIDLSRFKAIKSEEEYGQIKYMCNQCTF